jgi:signal transduction histidine kinase
MNAARIDILDLEPAALMEVGYRDQARVAAQLHDGLGQELAGIALMLQGVGSRLTTDRPELKSEIERIVRLVGEAVQSTRVLARALSPVHLERDGLSFALQGLAVHFGEIHGVQASFVNHLHASVMPNVRLSHHLYRIAQEAMLNAVRHGGAKVIGVHLTAVRRMIRLTITDDGCGLPADLAGTKGMGLRIMRYRARISGGVIQFGSAQGMRVGQGTRVVCECPLQSPRLQSSSPQSSNDAARPGKSNLKVNIRASIKASTKEMPR